MALVTTTEMFKKAYDGGYAIGAFNVNNSWLKQQSSRIPISRSLFTLTTVTALNFARTVSMADLLPL